MLSRMKLTSWLPLAAFLCLSAGAALCPERLAAAPLPAGEEVFNFADQYVQIEAGVFSGESRGVSGLEVRLTPKSDWKLSASSASSSKPLRIKFTVGKCLKLKGATRYSAPDQAGTDDSGGYSEYYTKTASLRQEFTRQKCTQKNGFDSSANLTYLLCQDNKCVGPFSREIRFRLADK